MHKRKYSKYHRKPTRLERGFFSVDPRQLERARKADRFGDSVIKAILWFGYGFALMSWFVAVNGVILFSQMLKTK